MQRTRVEYISEISGTRKTKLSVSVIDWEVFVLLNYNVSVVVTLICIQKHSNYYYREW